MSQTVNRLTRQEAAEYIGCSLSKLYSMEKAGFMKGTYYQIGRRRLYITDELEKWIFRGGETAMQQQLYEKGCAGDKLRLFG